MNFYKNIKASRKCLLWVQESLGCLNNLYGYTGKSFSSCKGQQGGEVESYFFFRGLPNFLAIPIMNPLARVHDYKKAVSTVPVPARDLYILIEPVTVL